MAGPYTTNNGKKIITDRLQTSQATYTISGPKLVQMGEGSGQAQSTNKLAAEVGGRTTGTESIVTTSVTNDTYQVVSTCTASGSWAITESGMFCPLSVTNVSGTNSDMFAYSDFAVINLAANDSIQFTWKVQFT